MRVPVRDIRATDVIRYAGDSYTVEKATHGELYSFLTLEGIPTRFKAGSSVEKVFPYAVTVD